jgi:hypothetical protein
MRRVFRCGCAGGFGLGILISSLYALRCDRLRQCSELVGSRRCWFSFRNRTKFDVHDLKLRQFLRCHLEQSRRALAHFPSILNRQVAFIGHPIVEESVPDLHDFENGKVMSRELGRQ